MKLLFVGIFLILSCSEVWAKSLVLNNRIKSASRARAAATLRARTVKIIQFRKSGNTVVTTLKYKKRKKRKRGSEWRRARCRTRFALQWRHDDLNWYAIRTTCPKR